MATGWRTGLHGNVRRYSVGGALHTRPADGAKVIVSPPALTWPAIPGPTRYRVEVRNADGALRYECTVSEPLHWPNAVWPEGTYTWDVIELDRAGCEGRRRGTKSFTIVPGAPPCPAVPVEVLLARIPATHPRCLLLGAELPDFRATLRTTRARRWERFKNAADDLISTLPPAPPEPHLTADAMGSRLEAARYAATLRHSAGEALPHLALAYLLSGEQCYADAARPILRRLAEWLHGDGDAVSLSARWGDEAGLVLAESLHRAYDWLYEALDAEERERVRAACVATARQAYRRLLQRSFVTNPGESHAGRLLPYLAEMAIVLVGEAEEAPTWLDYAVRLLATSYPHWGGDDGGWAEGVAYAVAYNRLNVPALETVRKATGLDLWCRPFFRRLRHFFLYCASPCAEIAPFGDGADRTGPGTAAAGKYATLVRLHAHRFEDAQASWWVEQLPAEKDRAADFLSLYAAEPPAPTPPDDGPVARLFPDVGWVAFHSDLSRPASDMFVLFKSSPYGSASHSHADQNAFCIMKGGVALAIPSGYYGPLASAPHHAHWTCSTRANNCVLVDGEGQPIHEPTAAGRIVAFEDHRSWAYAAGDAAAAYAGRLRRFDRHLLFLPPGLLLVLDDVEAVAPATYQWLLHAFERMEISAATGEVISRRGGRALAVHLRCTLPLRFAQTDVFDPPYDTGIPPEFRREVRNQWHVAAATATRASHVRIAAAMVITGPGEEPAIRIEERPGWLGAHVDRGGDTTTGWVCLQPGTPPPVPCVDARGREILFAGVSSAGAAFSVPSLPPARAGPACGPKPSADGPAWG